MGLRMLCNILVPMVRVVGNIFIVVGVGDTVVVIIAVVAKCSLAIHAISSPNFSISDAIASVVPLSLMP